jgi:hypothetical protein
MEMKMMLSMPRTISKNVSVISASQVSALRKISIQLRVKRVGFFIVLQPL